MAKKGKEVGLLHLGQMGQLWMGAELLKFLMSFASCSQVGAPEEDWSPEDDATWPRRRAL